MTRAREGTIVLLFIVIGTFCIGYALGAKVAVGVFGVVTLYVGLR